MEFLKAFEDHTHSKTPVLREITRKSLNSQKPTTYVSNSGRPRSSTAVPPKKRLTVKVDSNQASARQLNTSDKENIGNDQSYRTNSQKMKEIVGNIQKKYAYDFEISRDHAPSPMTTNTTHIIQLEDSFHRRTSDQRPMTTIPSMPRKFYGDDDSADFDLNSINNQNYSKGYRYSKADKVMIELDEFEADLPPTTKNSKGTISTRAGTNASIKSVKNAKFERIKTPGNQSNRINISGISRAEDQDKPVNRTFDMLGQKKDKIELYNQILKKHLGKVTPKSPQVGYKTAYNKFDIRKTSNPQVSKTNSSGPGLTSNLNARKPSTASANKRPVATPDIDIKKILENGRKMKDYQAPRIQSDRRATNIPPGKNKMVKADSQNPIKHELNTLNHNTASSSSQPNATSKVSKPSMNNYKLDKVLGQGSYAIVKLATDKQSTQQVAIKIYEKYRLADPRKMKNVRREISILQTLDHPNIIKLHQTIETSRQINLVMEFIGKTSLHAYLKAKVGKKIEEQEAKKIFKQIVKGMSYCHSKNIVHRDLKLENILIDDQGLVKLIDFGFSICIPQDKMLNIFCGTPSYMAPEIVSKKNYKGHATDCWALGILLFTLLCGHFPFRGYDDRDLYAKIKKGKFDLPNHISPCAKNILHKMLKVNPEERYNVDQILMDEWLIL